MYTTNDVISSELILSYREHLIDSEKSENTVCKYLRDIRHFASFINSGGHKLDKASIIEYKRHLCECYKNTSANSMLTAANSFLEFIGRGDLCVKLLKIQRQIFLDSERELSQSEYKRLIAVCEGTRLSYIIKTICATGIRVSELQYITVGALKAGRAAVDCKSKMRVVFIPPKLCRMLLEYTKKAGIKAGSVFVTKSGKPLNRCNIWRDMKALCKKAGVCERKVFPHNLRHLFAKTFYSIEKDIVRLADILGHSSINTTRIYTMETGERHLAGLKRIQTLLMT